MVECAGLEIRYTGNRIGGSNPFLSAKMKQKAVMRRLFLCRTREGCDQQGNGMVMGAVQFQSTHPRGVRLKHPSFQKLKSRCFNPRTREGCDEALSRALKVF